MSADDEARAGILVRVDRATAFRVFTEEIDRWWRRGPRFRAGGRHESVVHLEPRLGGGLFEIVSLPSGKKTLQTGTITAWEPPTRLLVTWRAVNFRPGEATEVEVTFTERQSGTWVEIVHRGWSSIRPDHPVRHGSPPPKFLAEMAFFWADLGRAFATLAERPA